MKSRVRGAIKGAKEKKKRKKNVVLRIQEKQWRCVFPRMRQCE